jgi:hypothetical protein
VQVSARGSYVVSGGFAVVREPTGTAQWLGAVNIEPGGEAQIVRYADRPMSFVGVRFGHEVERMKLRVQVTINHRDVYPKPVPVAHLAGVVAAGDGPDEWLRAGDLWVLTVLNGESSHVEAFPYAVYRVSGRAAALVAIPGGRP